MKKFITILLALTVIFGLATTAFAAEDTTLIIENANGREFVGYKLLDVSISLKDDARHPQTCTGDHKDDCYNYSYTISNDDFRAILQAETLANGRNELWDGGIKPTDSTKVTDAQILKYLEGQVSDDGNVYHTMRAVADRLYRAILDANIDPTVEGLTDTNEIGQGYWLFADVTALDGYNANSLVMIDTKGMDKITISTKTDLPTVEKKVKDIEDSEDDNILDNPWHDSADHDLNDTVPFKLTATLPSNLLQFGTYKIVFHDELSEGLTLDTTSIKVLMYETKYKADVDTDLNDHIRNEEALADAFDIVTTGLTDGCTFEVVCDNVLDIEGVTPTTTFVVYYEATLNNDAVIGSGVNGEGNPNKVELEFSNDPYGDSTGTTPKDVVSVYTYQLNISKTDSQNFPLAGAGFTLYKKNLAGTYEPIGVMQGGRDSSLTEFSWKFLDDGDYMLEETVVPYGYNELADIYFSISAVHTENGEGAPSLISLDGGRMGTGEVTTGIIANTVVNNTGTALPETGAEGTFLLIAGGTLLVVMAAVFMITRKKMSIYED